MMHLPLRRLPPLLLAAALAASGCASANEPDESDQIKELQQRVLELQRKAAVSDVELTRLRQELADMLARQGGGFASAPPRRGAVSGSSSTAAPAPAPLPPTDVVEGMDGNGGSQRRSTIDETDILVPPPARPPSPASPAAPSSGTGRRSAAAPPAPAPLPPPPAGGGRGEPVTPAVQALYDRGYTLYHQKHFVDAEASFQRFLQAEPNSELADNAQYWIGECRYSRGDMRGALAAFREAVARYPQGNKTPDALLKAGMCLESLGDREGARTTYQEVLHRFPGTAVAAVAEERRAKLP
jgi:tol-pal system protein YbgF